MSNTFNQVKSRRVRLLLGWVTAQEDFSCCRLYHGIGCLITITKNRIRRTIVLAKCNVMSRTLCLMFNDNVMYVYSIYKKNVIILLIVHKTKFVRSSIHCEFVRCQPATGGTQKILSVCLLLQFLAEIRTNFVL